ncbi:hypothetical protein J2T47_003064 [Pseudomonas nitroreducens]|nr:hypothetical protein [Pseudomonas nitroreducens]
MSNKAGAIPALLHSATAGAADAFTFRVQRFARRTDQRQTFVQPAGHPADHLLHRASQRGELRGGAVHAIAVRPGAVDDEQGARRELRHAPCIDLAGGQVQRSGYVPAGEGGSMAHIKQDEILLAVLSRMVHVRAVGLERQAVAEMGEGVGGQGRGELADEAGHGKAPVEDGSTVCGSRSRLQWRF